MPRHVQRLIDKILTLSVKDQMLISNAIDDHLVGPVPEDDLDGAVERFTQLIDEVIAELPPHAKIAEIVAAVEEKRAEREPIAPSTNLIRSRKHNIN